MTATDEMIAAFEGHDVAAVRTTLAAGADAVRPVRGKAPVAWLIGEYTRSDNFVPCLAALLDAGASIGDPLIAAVLLDDADRLQRVLRDDPSALHRRLDLDGAYTSLRGVTALHLAAEYNAIRTARVLIAAGAELDARGDIDGDGVGGQTPIFHCVNSNGNYCRPVMEMLADAGADLDARVSALRWGGGRSWETVIFDVTPVSYAQCGLMAQFHRAERPVYDTIGFLLNRREGRVPPIPNVPNRYLVEGARPTSTKGRGSPWRWSRCARSRGRRRSRAGPG